MVTESVGVVATELRITRDSWSSAAEWLLRNAEAELRERYPDYIPTPLQPEDVEQTSTALFVARFGDAAVGCIVVRPWHGEEAAHMMHIFFNMMLILFIMMLI